MAKLLTEEQYNELIADRERLEWLEANALSVHPKTHKNDTNLVCWWTGDKARRSYGDTMREAIDKARGVK